MAKSTKQLLKAAKALPATGKGCFEGGLNPYAEIIHVLRIEKAMTWAAITQWLKDQGLPRRYSVSSVRTAHVRYLATLGARGAE